MVRAVLVGILSVCAGAACGGRDDAAAVPAGTAAGKVVEVTGAVEATRNGAARALAPGAEVYADDVVSTPAGGSIVIELFHNHARWSVESGRTARVDASLAWGLAKQQATAPVDHATAAAGRNAERSAADTVATAAPTAEPAPPVAASATSTTPAPGRAGRSQAEERARETAPVDRQEPMMDERTPAPPPPPPPPKPLADVGGGRAETGVIGGAAAPGGGVLAKDAIEGGSPRGRDLAPPKERRSAPVATVATELAQHRDKLAACLDAATPKVTLAVVVRAGAARFVVTGGSAEVRACVERVGKTLRFASDGRATLELAR